MADLTYKQLQKQVTALQRRVARAAEAIRVEAKAIEKEATDTARIAECIATMRVDSTTVSETRELSKIMTGLSEAAISYASAADTTARAAQHTHDTNHASHDGINEAVNRAPVQNVHDVHREWFTQH